MPILVHIFLENFFQWGCGGGGKCSVYEPDSWDSAPGHPLSPVPKLTRTGMGKNISVVISGKEAKVKEGLEEVT